jgi:parallel beta-helix repeat protein
VAARLTDPALRLIDLSPIQHYQAGHLPLANHAWWQDSLEVNNTIYGAAIPSGTGIVVSNNSGPTLLNNIVANTTTGISVDASSAPKTVL